jgi:KipI family sensor histidine kinase inhibitor
VRLAPVGDSGVVVDCADLAAAQRLRERLAERLPSGAVDVVLGARSVLVRVVPGTDLTSVARAVRAAAASAPAEPAGRRPSDPEPVEVTLPVRYDGPDLAAVAELTGLSVAGVVAAHTESTWTVAFAGFAPGFAYLSGGDRRLRVPRLDEPRPRVPTGAVGLAGEFSGVYPRPSPGGWRLIGSTDAALWDVHRDPPALLAPGARVRFEAVT